ncbi:MAG: 2-amino-4-hydroxy-6-hydroxymethyldihydropteridine diphosphokinase, partial [Chitinophagaceae bacterium]|nr:2-amino-4-hydroxy-6-hydroxymethyldihydropteridine diphosphokinase [Chitinophagaceae bacterium]
MSTAYLLLGSNQGDRQAILQQALVLLEGPAGHIVQRSGIYETAAWGNTDQPSFLNQAVQLQTRLAPEALLSATQAIEHRLGRLRIEKWGQRTLDIDILFYDDLQMDTPQLRIPHPELGNRRFA